jgi:hypothetical protein
MVSCGSDLSFGFVISARRICGQVKTVNKDKPVLMPSEVSMRVGFFDRFAGLAALVASRAYFFAFCVLMIVLWVPTFVLIKDVNTWQLIINTATTIVTFLMVALLQNSQTRSDQAIQHKLNAIADGLADLMMFFKADDPDAMSRLHNDMVELRDAVGLETHESTTDNRRGAESARFKRGRR